MCTRCDSGEVVENSLKLTMCASCVADVKQLVDRIRNKVTFHSSPIDEYGIDNTSYIGVNND
jgi:hypothetical protein